MVKSILFLALIIIKSLGLYDFPQIITRFKE